MHWEAWSWLLWPDVNAWWRANVGVLESSMNMNWPSPIYQLEWCIVGVFLYSVTWHFERLPSTEQHSLVWWCDTICVSPPRDRTQSPTTLQRNFTPLKSRNHTKQQVYNARSPEIWSEYEPTHGNETHTVWIHREGQGDWTQEGTIRHRAANHSDRKCTETEDTRDGDFKIKQETQPQNSRSWHSGSLLLLWPSVELFPVVGKMV